MPQTSHRKTTTITINRTIYYAHIHPLPDGASLHQNIALWVDWWVLPSLNQCHRSPHNCNRYINSPSITIGWKTKKFQLSPNRIFNPSPYTSITRWAFSALKYCIVGWLLIQPPSLSLTSDLRAKVFQTRSLLDTLCEGRNPKTTHFNDRHIQQAKRQYEGEVVICTYDKRCYSVIDIFNNSPALLLINGQGISHAD